MLYFDSLPKISVRDENGYPIALTNIMTRARLIEEFENNPMLFYQYIIQEGDTPEIVADKYYDDSYRYWIVLYSNRILDPLWDWPLTSDLFLKYIDNKYAAEAEAEDQTPFEYTNTTVYTYQKITKTINLQNNNENIVYTTLSESDFNSLVPSSTTYTIPNAPSCIVDISKRSITIFDYEYQKNEDKKVIKLLNRNFVANFEQVFREVMGAE
jgi:hypothetical protein